MLAPHELVALFRECGGCPDEAGEAVDPGRLHAVLARPHATRAGLPVYPTLFAKVAALLHAIVHEKPFATHNREVALACARRILAEHGYRLDPPAGETERFLTGVELGLTTPQRAALWLKRHTRRSAT